MFISFTKKLSLSTWKSTAGIGVMLALFVAGYTISSVPVSAQSAPELSDIAVPKTEADGRPKIPVPLTESPHDTLNSFFELRDELESSLDRYLEEQTGEQFERLKLIFAHLRSLIDLSQVPLAEQRFVGDVTSQVLLDILGRIKTPELDSVPDETAFQAGAPAAWRLPQTPLRIVRIDEGERVGEFLFGPRTVRAAPRFLQGIQELPLDSRLDIKSWAGFVPQLTGPLIPTHLVVGMPVGLRALWLDTPIWKTIAYMALVLASLAFLLGLHRFMRRKDFENPVLSLLSRMTVPIATLTLIWLVYPFVLSQLILTGQAFLVFYRILVVIQFVAGAWLFWLAVQMLAEWAILSRRVKIGSLDADLFRLIAAIISVIGVVIIIAIGAQVMGVPVLSLIAGLGIGGLAVALAIRPTLENLIGGLILYIDRPVRVGDYCTFGSDSGTVERIGVRSTEVRALDRTLISVPNAQFVDMKLINWAHCDRMLINAVIGLRFETKPDQLRYVLVKIREMLHAHPRIDSDTIRVRYDGPGESSRNVSIRIYALTQEWNDFYAIREDVFLRIDAIVEEAGSGYAFPSQTVYMARDENLDPQLQDQASSTVERWRQTGLLPFPRLSETEIARLKGTLDYPPRGSVDAKGKKQANEDVDDIRNAEPLSAEPADAQPVDETKTQLDKR